MFQILTQAQYIGCVSLINLWLFLFQQRCTTWIPRIFFKPQFSVSAWTAWTMLFSTLRNEETQQKKKKIAISAFFNIFRQINQCWAQNISQNVILVPYESHLSPFFICFFLFLLAWIFAFLWNLTVWNHSFSKIFGVSWASKGYDVSCNITASLKKIPHKLCFLEF